MKINIETNRFVGIKQITFSNGQSHNDAITIYILTKSIYIA